MQRPAHHNVTITFLGSGDAFGSGGRLQTCIAVASPTSNFLIDCGASALVAMKRYAIAPATIDTILITHLHGDHFGGIPFFILEAQLVSKRRTPLTLAGPPGLEARVQAAMEVFFPGSSRIQQAFPITYVELPASVPTVIGPLLVTPEAMLHPSGAPSYALRILCAERTLVYSGDTEWTEALGRIAHGADLCICEAYFYEKDIKFHLNYRTVLAHRDALQCKRLMLTHMSDDMLARLDELDIDYAEDGKVVIL